MSIYIEHRISDWFPTVRRFEDQESAAKSVANDARAELNIVRAALFGCQYPDCRLGYSQGNDVWRPVVSDDYYGLAGDYQIFYNRIRDDKEID